jgi:hypothetical protein
MIRRTQSRSISEESLAVFLSTYKYYSAIFEFAQGSAPLTVFECGDSAFDVAGFRLWIVNTPAHITSGWNSPPTIVRSAWGGLHYICYHIQVQDVQARGFARAISFVVANARSELMTGIYSCRRKDFDAIATLLQRHPMELFLIEIQGYVQSLDRLLETVAEPEQRTLVAKRTELAQLMEAAGISKITDDTEPVDRPIDYFTRINNDLRPIRDLINVSEVGLIIKDFTDSLPTNPFHGKLAPALWNCPIVYGKAFLTTVAVGTSGCEGHPFPICPAMIQNRIFHSCLFCLFSGRTLVLKSLNSRAALHFAERLSVVSPFGEPFSIVEMQRPVGFEYFKYDIVISQNIESPKVAILNLDELAFAGSVCPPESIVLQEFGRSVDETEGRTLLVAANDAKRLFSRFRWKLAEVAARGIQTEERVIHAMKSLRFAQCDVPICRYWMARLVNQQPNVKPILMDYL